MKFLVIQHVAHEHPGYIADWARERNVNLDVVELWKPYEIPSPAAYQALIIMGGPMGVYENYSSEEEEVRLIKSTLGKLPIMGFCLGSQLLAHALGARVYPNIRDAKRVKEIGYFDIDLTKSGKSSPILAGFPSPFNVLEWHGDAFDLPKGATLLATSALCTNQAFAFKNAFGFLFHFEFKPEMVKKQIEVDRDWIHQDNEVDEDDLAKQAEEKAGIMKKQCYQLMDNFSGFC